MERGGTRGCRIKRKCTGAASYRDIEMERYIGTGSIFPRPRKPPGTIFLSRGGGSYSGPVVDIVSLRGDSGFGIRFAGHARRTVKSSRIFWHFFAGGVRDERGRERRYVPVDHPLLSALCFLAICYILRWNNSAS